MGSKRNHAKKNKRKANNWRNIIKMRKPKKKLSISERVDENNDKPRSYDNDNLDTTETDVDADSERSYDNDNLDTTETDVDADSERSYDHNNLDTTETDVDADNDVEEQVQMQTPESVIVDCKNEMNENSYDEIDYVMEDITEIKDEFDEYIEVDYGNSEESGDEEGRQKIQIEDTYHYLESDTVIENEQHILNENESVTSLQHSNAVYERDEFDNLDDTNVHCSDNIGLNRQSISGRRIVDIGFLFQQMQELYNHHFEDCDSRMIFQKETKLGLRSIFHFYCPNCGKKRQVQSSSKNDETINVSRAATLGITSIGSGYYHLEEFCANVDIPCMSSSTFDTENKRLQEDWIKLAKCNTKEALKEEIRMAIDRGDVDSAGNALICVTCDGSWGKRSYGKGFSSLSGSAAIISFHTKKVLYYDTKNKHCNICVKSYAKTCPPNDHPCNISYSGPSSGMETEILVEGFKWCERFGARFNKIISDGDSSAFKEISEAAIYQNPEIIIEKVECINHLFKNFRKKFEALTKDTKFKLNFRKEIKLSTGDDICKGLRIAAKHWRESDINIIEKLENLEKDCLNAPYHYFGNHENCNKYFCKKTTTSKSAATIDLLKTGGVFHEILKLCNIYFASNVKSLLEDCTNNSAEELNNIIAKYLGGKRINYSLAGSYSARVAAAVVQYNSKGHAGSEFHKQNSLIQNNLCLKMENERNRHYAKNEAARKLKPRKKTTQDKTTKGYKDGERPDLSERALEVAKNIELEKLETDRVNRDVILRDTIGMKHNDRWIEIRKRRINCNYFGRIINARGPQSYPNILEEMLYNPIEFGNTAQVCHQRMYQQEALKMFTLVHHDHELLQTAASPLRLYGSDSIVNVQCPVKAFGKTIHEALSMKKPLDIFKKKDGDLCTVNVKSHCYAEIQGQLHITGRRFAFLVVWLGKECVVKKVEANHLFWDKKMKNKLQLFFDEAMIKELSNSRRARKMALRQYDKRTKTFI